MTKKKIPVIIFMLACVALGLCATRSAWSATLLPDLYEVSPDGNESREFASDLGILGSESLLLEDLTIHQLGDIDYYQWTPLWGAETERAVRIEAHFTHNAGRDLDMALREMSLRTIRTSDSLNDNELITESLVGGQSYLIKVFGFNNESTNQYDLSVTFPGGTTTDPGGGGDSGDPGGGNPGDGGPPTLPPPPISTSAGPMLTALMDTVETRDMYGRAQQYFMTKFSQALKTLNTGGSARDVLFRLDQANTMLLPYRRRLAPNDKALLYTSIQDIIQEIVPGRRENSRVRRALFGRGAIPTNFSAIQPEGELGDGQTSVGYNADTGEVWVDAPAGTELTSISIDSSAHIFTADAAQNLGDSFDNSTEDNIFKATFGSTFGSLSFGNVAEPGLTEEFLLNDLAVIGSLAAGGELGQVDLVYVPEPSPWALLSVCLLGLLVGGWRCRRCAA